MSSAAWLRLKTRLEHFLAYYHLDNLFLWLRKDVEREGVLRGALTEERVGQGPEPEENKLPFSCL